MIVRFAGFVLAFLMLMPLGAAAQTVPSRVAGPVEATGPGRQEMHDE